MRERFEVILIDGPSVVETAALLRAPCCDAMFLVARKAKPALPREALLTISAWAASARHAAHPYRHVKKRTNGQTADACSGIRKNSRLTGILANSATRTVLSLTDYSMVRSSGPASFLSDSSKRSNPAKSSDRFVGLSVIRVRMHFEQQAAGAGGERRHAMAGT